MRSINFLGFIALLFFAVVLVGCPSSTNSPSNGDGNEEVLPDNPTADDLGVEWIDWYIDENKGIAQRRTTDVTKSIRYQFSVNTPLGWKFIGTYYDYQNGFKAAHDKLGIDFK